MVPGTREVSLNPGHGVVSRRRGAGVTGAVLEALSWWSLKFDSCQVGPAVADVNNKQDGRARPEEASGLQGMGQQSVQKPGGNVARGGHG